MKKLMAAVILAIIVSSMMSCAYLALDVTETQQLASKSSALVRATAIATTQPETVTITGSWHVRSCAGVECSVVGYVYDGDTLELRETSNGWLLLSNGSVTGWVNDGCCKK